MYDRDMRDMRGMDGRNPYGSRGGYVVPSRGGRGRGRGRRGDRGMDYGYDGRVIRSYPTIHPQGDYGEMREDMRMRDYDMARNQPRGRNGRFRRDYGDDMRGGDYESDMRGGDYGMDGHHYPQGQMGGYQPIEAMGYFNGYYGTPDHGDYRGRRDYGDYGDYGYDDFGDFGETLSEKEIEKWAHKLMSQLDEREKQMFQKDTIMQKVKQMGKSMDGFGEKEMWVATLMVYTDYKQTISQNLDMAIKLAYDWLSDKDVAVKGAMKLATYYDCIVEGE